VESRAVGIFFFLSTGNIAFALWVIFLFGLLRLHWWEWRTLSKDVRLRSIQHAFVVGQVVWLDRCHLVYHLSIQPVHLILRNGTLFKLLLFTIACPWLHPGGRGHTIDSTIVIRGLIELLGHLNWLLRHGWHLDHAGALVHRLLLWWIHLTRSKLRLLMLLLLLMLAHL
jgi:hypothetical protein